jgi:hypothetical protein
MTIVKKNEIDTLCEEFGITNYTINDDGTIDVDGHVDLSYKGLTTIPLQFGKVSMDFDCSGNKLTSLEGCPKELGYGQDFNCSYNQLTSLKGCPISVCRSFKFDGNPISKESIWELDSSEFYNPVFDHPGWYKYYYKLTELEWIEAKRNFIQ